MRAICGKPRLEEISQQQQQLKEHCYQWVYEGEQVKDDGEVLDENHKSWGRGTIIIFNQIRNKNNSTVQGVSLSALFVSSPKILIASLVDLLSPNPNWSK